MLMVPKIPEQERTPVVAQLLEIIDHMQEEIQKLKDEIARLKGQKPRPKIKPSNMEKTTGEKQGRRKPGEKRPGSQKRNKTEELEIDEITVIEPDTIPEWSRFKGYQDSPASTGDVTSMTSWVIEWGNNYPNTKTYVLLAADGSYVGRSDAWQVTEGFDGEKTWSFTTQPEVTGSTAYALGLNSDGTWGLYYDTVADPPANEDDSLESFGWRRPFVVAERHPAWGADLASQHGVSELAASLIARHQEQLPPSAENESSVEDSLLLKLQAVDNKN